MIKIPQTMTRAELEAYKDHPEVNWAADCIDSVDGEFIVSKVNEYTEQHGDEEIVITECVGDTEEYEIRIVFRPNVEGGKTDISAHCIAAGGNFGFGSM
jgi:hypothetical protein